MLNKIIGGDCLKVMEQLPDNSIDLICVDPPYHKFVKAHWDNQFSSNGEFLNWIDKIAQQWQRVLKPNGSLYCFTSPRMSSRVELKLGERFNVLNRINWAKPSGRHQKCRVSDLRGYFSQTENIIFCDHYNSDHYASGEASEGVKFDEAKEFIFQPLLTYFQTEKRRGKMTAKQIVEATDCYVVERHSFQRSQFAIPTEARYLKLQQGFPGYFLRPYSEIRLEYDTLKRCFDMARREFSVEANIPYTDNWTFPCVQPYPGKHIAEKPAKLLEHIISVSSRPGDVVLDCFAGSGSTLLAAKKLERNYIGVELDPHWVNYAKLKLNPDAEQLTLINAKMAHI